MKRPISIVGGSGFIGTRFVKRLTRVEKWKPTIVDKNPSFAFPELAVLGDVRSLGDLRAAVAEGAVIVNLAAEHRDDVRPASLYDDVNVDGARNICAVAREKNSKTIVFTSSVAVYGFAPLGRDESGQIAPFNDYGRTKYEAETVFKKWQAESPNSRTLIIVRPTVVFGEQNRGNVYNLLRQVASGRFVMVGNGENRKSMAYVENVAAFLEYCLEFSPGTHVFNFVDKPDFTMNSLVGSVNEILGRRRSFRLRIPYAAGYAIGSALDVVSLATGRKFSISAIRVKKFCSNSVYNTAVEQTEFVTPVPLHEALKKTVQYEFLESHESEGVFYAE